MKILLILLIVVFFVGCSGKHFDDWHGVSKWFSDSIRTEWESGIYFSDSAGYMTDRGKHIFMHLSKDGYITLITFAKDTLTIDSKYPDTGYFRSNTPAGIDTTPMSESYIQRHFPLIPAHIKDTITMGDAISSAASLSGPIFMDISFGGFKFDTSLFEIRNDSLIVRHQNMAAVYREFKTDDEKEAERKAWVTFFIGVFIGTIVTVSVVKMTNK